MVGGSVNGRPFREDPTSYLKTGIPCGNPRRFASRGVVRMVPNKHVAFENQRLDMPPSEKMETEGERQFKRILDKQLNKNMTVDDVMKQRREFKTSFSYQSVTEQVSGKFSLDDFKVLEQAKDEHDHLQQCGLDEDEMMLHVKSKMSNNDTEKRKLNPDILQQKLAEIDEKIQARVKELEKPDKFRDLHYISRHEMEIEKSLKPNSVKEHCFKTLMTTEKTPGPDSHPDDPINHLKQLESDMFNHLREGKRKKRKRKRLQKLNDAVAEMDAKLCKSQDDLLQLQGMMNAKATTRKCITNEEIQSNKLSVETIMQMPRFQNYSTGEPSNVLYIKNLVRNVQLEDLYDLFQRFSNETDDTPRIKLMQSRMHGQAFVTFSSTDVASKALNLLNGYLLKGKPLIISYGKQNAA